MAFGGFMASTRAFIVAREREADRRWLQDVIAGRVDLMSLDVFPRMEPMFSKYDDADPVMKRLLERAASGYADFAVSAACWALAGSAIEEAQHRGRGF